jgi:hypothetical protein
MGGKREGKKEIERGEGRKEGKGEGIEIDREDGDGIVVGLRSVSF